MTYIESLKVAIANLKQLSHDLGLNEYEEIELYELEVSLKEAEGYQYLSDNDIEY